MKNVACSLLLVLLCSGVALAAPTTLTLKNMSSAGQTNYAATCSVVGVLDNTDRINDNNERINTASLRTVSLTKGGMANYSTVLNTKGNQFRVACVRSDGTDQVVKMFFDNIATFWMPIFKGIYRFY